MAVDIFDGIKLPPSDVIDAIQKQQRNGVEVRPAEPNPHKIDIDLKNPVFIVQKKTVWRVSGVFKDGEKKEAVSETKKQLAETKEMEVKGKYKQLHEFTDKEATYENINHILATPRKLFLEADIYGLYKGKFDKDNNIVVQGAKIIKKWTPEYKKMIEAWLAELRTIMHALITDAEERGENPDIFKSKVKISDTDKKETNVLLDNFKRDFRKKLERLPDYKGSKVENAIEKGVLEIRKIPNRDGYAIYESRIGNLVYIVKLDGTMYTNIDKYRTREMLSDFFAWWYIRIWYWKIELDKKTGLWRLYKKDWEEVPIFSDEYATATLNAINEMWDAVSHFDKLIKEKENVK